MKGVDSKRQFLIENKVGKAKGVLASMLRKYWTNRIEAMPEGKVLDMYYKETRHA